MGNISTNGTISAKSFLGNATSASKWETPRTFTIGYANKDVDGSANISWPLSEIGAAYYHVGFWDFFTAHDGGYVTFDINTDFGWINGFVSTHHNYLSSYLLNLHRTDKWYVCYAENENMSDPKELLHSGNWSSYCAAASHTHNYLPVSGGALSGGLTIRSYDFSLKTVPSSSQLFQYLRYADKDNLCPFFIQTSYNSSGDVITDIATRNYDSTGGLVSGGAFQLKALKDGSGCVYFSHAIVGSSNVYGSTLPDKYLMSGRIFYKLV